MHCVRCRRGLQEATLDLSLNPTSDPNPNPNPDPNPNPNQVNDMVSEAISNFKGEIYYDGFVKILLAN